MSGKRQTRKRPNTTSSDNQGQKHAKKLSNEKDRPTSRQRVLEQLDHHNADVCGGDFLKSSGKNMTRTKSLSEKFSYKKKPVKTKENTAAPCSENVLSAESQVSYTKQSEQITKKRMTLNEPEDDIFLKNLNASGFEKNTVCCQRYVSPPSLVKSHNMVHFLQQMSFGVKSRCHLKQSIKTPVVDMFRDFKLCRVASPFDRRVTAIEWHPTLPNVVAVGSKGGDIIIWNTLTADKDKFISGIGAAGSCQAMKFWPWDLSRIVSASINGTVTLHDFEGRQDTILADTMDSYDHWYCSVDVNPSRYMVAAGRNQGILHLMSSEGRRIFEYRLHKNKVTHVEFSPGEEWLLCTASTDSTVQFWDVRYMKDRKSALTVLKHDKPVNSAYFSLTDGCRLLTTDQKNEIRVYKAPEWALETTIQHPHRFFQHISPFKATWHPLQDLIVCGRYPDKDFPGYKDREPRTLDLFDAQSGDMLAKLQDPEVDGLCPLNKFNSQGDALVSGMGFHLKLWKRNDVINAIQKEMLEKLKSSNLLAGLSNRQNNRSRSSRTQGRDNDNDDDDDADFLKKKKKKPKSNTGTKLDMKSTVKTKKNSKK